MKNVNMLFNNKLPTNLYTTFQIIKLLIKKGNLNLIHNKIYISTLYIKFLQVQHYIHFNIPIYKKEKLIHEFILYTRNFLHEMESKWRVSIKTNNENEKYIFHFMFSYKYSTYQIIKDHCNEKQVTITYQVMGRQQITPNIIHENL